MKHIHLFLLFVFFSNSVIAQPYILEREISSFTANTPSPTVYLGLEDVTVDESGNMYVLDGYKCMVLIFSRSGEFISKWGSPGEKNNQLDYPNGIAYDYTSGNIYIADTGNNRIIVFDKQGNFIKKWGSYGNRYFEFSSPIDIALDNKGNVYVADQFNNSIKKFNNDGIYKGQLGGPKSNQFNNPLSIEINKSGNFLIVSDLNNDRIQYFNNNGLVTSQMISNNSVGGYLSPQYYKRGLALDPFGNFFISDFLDSYINKINSNGDLIKTWSVGRGTPNYTAPPQRITTDQNGLLYVLAGRHVNVYSNNGEFILKLQTNKTNNPGSLYNPQGIAVDSNGYIYVVEADIYSDVHRISKFNTDGSFNKSWGSKGSKEGQLFAPHGIAVDSMNNLYVTDGYNQRIQKFNSNGDFLYQFPLLKTSGYFEKLKINNDGNLITSGLQTYSPTGELLNQCNTTFPPEDYVIDSLNNIYVIIKIPTIPEDVPWIQKYSSTGTLLSEVSDLTVSSAPVINEKSDLFLINGLYVIQFNSDLTIKGSFKCYDKNSSSYDFPSDITVDKNGKLYIADGPNNRILIFKPNKDYVPVTTSNKAAQNNYSVVVYPNPSTGSFSIATDDLIEQVTITNVNGQQEIFRSKEISTTFKGLLLIDIKSNKGRSVQKIIVE